MMNLMGGFFLVWFILDIIVRFDPHYQLYGINYVIFGLIRQAIFNIRMWLYPPPKRIPYIGPGADGGSIILGSGAPGKGSPGYPDGKPGKLILKLGDETFLKVDPSDDTVVFCGTKITMEDLKSRLNTMLVESKDHE